MTKATELRELVRRQQDEMDSLCRKTVNVYRRFPDRGVAVLWTSRNTKPRGQAFWKMLRIENAARRKN